MRTMRPVPQNVFENLPEEILVIVRVSYLYAYMYDYGGSRLWPSFRSGRTRKTDPAQLSYQYLTSIYGNGSARFTSCTAPLSCRSLLISLCRVLLTFRAAITQNTATRAFFQSLGASLRLSACSANHREWERLCWQLVGTAETYKPPATQVHGRHFVH